MFRDAGHTPFVRSRRGKSATPTPSPSPAPRSSARLGGAAPQPAAAAAAASLLAFAPHPDLSALVLVLVRVLGAYFVTSQWDRDADEAYNYWEPAHFMLYGAGMQTWEANVRYMFRSYGFSGVGAALGFVLGGFHGDDKVTVLYRVRMALALGCAAAEAFLYTSVRLRFGARVALLMLAGSLLSVGMLFVAPALLPNSFTMVGFTLAWGLWLREQHAAAAAVAAGALALGFPFAALALPPLGLHMLGSTLPRQLLEGTLRPLRPLWAWCEAPRAGAARRGGAWDWAPLLGLLSAGAASLALCTAYAACVDRLYYGVWASFQGNTLLYNLNLRSDGNGRGSDNFADPTVAGRSWYVKNLFYSHNVVALLALGSPVLLLAAALLRGGCSARSLAPSPSTSWRAALAAQLWLYFAVFSLKAHKEERFMYPIYPLLPLLAALAVDALVEALAARCSALAWPAARAASRPLLLALLAALALAAAALSLSRAAMLTSAYSGHLAVWTAFARASAYRLEAPGGSGEQPPLHAWAHPVRGLLGRDAAASAPPGVTVCAGQEWHRFPGSFFLPERTASESGGPAVLRYVRFEPPGVSHPCLPHAYNASSAAAAAQPNALFNSDNAEVPQFFVQPDACHYLVDFLGRAGAGSAMQPWFEQGSAGLAGGQCVAGWRAVFSAPFLDRAASEGASASGARGTLRTLATRTFYVPWLTPQLQEWGTYYLLKKC